MKQLLKIKTFIAIFLFLSGICQAQKLMKTVSDAKELEAHKDKFVGKPLKLLLNEIEPEIKSVIGNPNKTHPENSFLIFSFVDDSTYNKQRAEGKFPTLVRVMLANYNRPTVKSLNNRPTKWAKEYEKEFGELIIADIRVTREN